MLEQFRIVDDIHRWLRRAIWGVIVSGSVILFWISGGFPPRAWQLLAEVIPQVSRLWTLRGPAILLPLALLVAQSLVWVVAWAILMGTSIAFVRRGRQVKREQFDEDVRLVHNAVTEEQEALPSNRSRSTFGLPGHPQTVSHYWQRELLSRLDVGVGWDAGTKRKDKPNEDSIIALQGSCIYNTQLVPFGLFVVADGMGGYANGQDASYLAIQAVVKSVLPNIVGSRGMNDDLLIRMLAEGIQQANLVVCRRSLEANVEMGTTITAALVIASKAFVVNVGDSRTYLYRESEGLSQVTHDHSQVARLVAAHQIAPDEVYTHPDRNQVYRALGAEQQVEIDWFIVPLQIDDRLLLCSDGLWEMVRDPEIEKILKQRGCNPSQASDALIGAALKGGGLDNISAIVVRLTPMTV